jgi:hypothetical protein
LRGIVGSHRLVPPPILHSEYCLDSVRHHSRTMQQYGQLQCLWRPGNGFALAALVVPLVLLLRSSSFALAYDVPLEKADPPKMNPRPTLPEITHKVYFTMSIDGKEQEEAIVFGLFGHTAPKAVENFVALASCDRGNSKITGKPLCYKGSPFHRIVPEFGISGTHVVPLPLSESSASGGADLWGSMLLSFFLHTHRRRLCVPRRHGVGEYLR